MPENLANLPKDSKQAENFEISSPEALATGIKKEVAKRRTLCLISHPDAGKTTVTEKILLFGKAIQFAGTVKSRKSKKFATSDWMEIEKQRGISVTAAVMRFSYKNYEINLLDTPGHQDFLEETYRSITAVDSALMIIDCAKGVEEQTLKLWEVCKQQNIPVIAFVNKLDRDGLSPFLVMEKIEKALSSQTYAFTWPVGQGKDFKGVYDRVKKNMRLFRPKESENLDAFLYPNALESEECQEKLGEHFYSLLKQDLELLEIAGNSFDHQKYLSGQMIPVFFGSAMNNFGLVELLEHYLNLAPSPLPRLANTRLVFPEEPNVSGFVFKVQANMDPKHRDRIAFLRLCSGKFTKGMKLFHSRLRREMKIANPLLFMAQERETADEAYAGDIIGVFDVGNFRLGDSVSAGELLQFKGIPNFAPEFFSLVKLLSPLKSKQLEKGLLQLSEEGNVQVFRKIDLPHHVVGVVGRLQFEVIKFRLQHEYGVELEFQTLPFQCARWVEFDSPALLEDFMMANPSQVFYDSERKPILLANSLWELEYLMKKYTKGRYFETRDIQ